MPLFKAASSLLRAQVLAGSGSILEMVRSCSPHPSMRLRMTCVPATGGCERAAVGRGHGVGGGHDFGLRLHLHPAPAA